MALSNYQKQLARIKNGQEAKTTGPKPRKPIAKKSAKKIVEEKEARKQRGGEDETFKEKWFKARRKELVGVCQCGCARKSSKHENDHFRSSIAHIFPKAKFISVALHPLNYVERNFWDGCHARMDQMGLNKWPMYADWEDIKAKFHELAPLLTVEEKSTKFYTHLEKLVYAN